VRLGGRRGNEALAAFTFRQSVKILGDGQHILLFPDHRQLRVTSDRVNMLCGGGYCDLACFDISD